MTEHHAQQPGEGPGYETRDVNVRAVAWLALGVAGIAAIVQLVLWLLLSDWSREAKRSDPAPSPLAANRPLAPEPRPRQPMGDRRRVRDLDRGRARGHLDDGRVRHGPRRRAQRALPLLVLRELIAEGAAPS